MVYKKIAASLPNTDKTEVKLIISMYHKVGLTVAFRLENRVMKKEKPFLMD
jgi:hypothetical protein